MILTFEFAISKILAIVTVPQNRNPYYGIKSAFWLVKGTVHP
jgi:hypothetical protein